MGIFDNLFTFSNAYKNLKEIGKVEFISTSYVRGQTFDNAAIFIDEIGGLTYHEIFSVLTRVGENSRFIMAGDFAQNDLVYKRFLESGFPRLEKVIQKIPSIERIHFTRDDIVRSSFVKDLIIADEDTPDF
jgi:phosphate starvation-inducible protein PhoH and related proteins